MNLLVALHPIDGERKPANSGGVGTNGNQLKVVNDAPSAQHFADVISKFPDPATNPQFYKNLEDLTSTIPDLPTNTAKAFGEKLLSITDENHPKQPGKLLEILGSDVASITDPVAKKAFIDGLANDPTLIDTWKDVEHATTHRRDIDFLNSLKLIKNNTQLHIHIFIGNKHIDVTNLTKPVFEVTGIHHYSAITTNTTNFQNLDTRVKGIISENLATGVKKVKIQCYHEDWKKTQSKGTPLNELGWKRMDDKTFFPDWTQKRTLEEIAFALKNKQNPVVDPISGSTKYDGACLSGFDLTFFIDNNGKMLTVYPK